MGEVQGEQRLTFFKQSAKKLKNSIIASLCLCYENKT